jgi:hypothetical protein
MKEEQSTHASVLSLFHQALDSWGCNQNEQPLTRWLARELDREGRLTRLSISNWQECLAQLLEAKGRSRIWPVNWEQPLTRLNQAVLRFSRPDGSPATNFEPSNGRAELGPLLRSRTNASKDMASESANGRASFRANGDLLDDERPEWDGCPRVLAALGSDRLAGGDFLVVDHRETGIPCRFELFGGGRSLLGPSWTIAGASAATSIPKPGSWLSNPAAEVAEWSYLCGDNRITQSAVLLKTRRLALLGLIVEGRSALPGESVVRVSLPPSVQAAAAKDHRGLLMSDSRKRGSAQVLPIALPSLSYTTERGALSALGDALILKQTTVGRRCWLPLLVSWDPRRNRKGVHWRVLTVSEKSRIVPADRAFAVRVSWGRDETYVIYRSLGPAASASRSFLGYQTTARFFVGLFTPDGTVTPIMKLE